MLNKEMHAIVFGHVQGVGFRATTKRHADKLKLTGYAHNLPDGSVEICAQGDKQALEALLQHLTSSFDVQHVSLSYRPIHKMFASFVI